MARTDSGLEWSCDSKYYVQAANTLLLNMGSQRDYRKINDGAAVVGILNAADGYSGPIVISTVPENTYYTYNESTVALSVINGQIWFMAREQYWLHTSSGVTTDFPQFSEPSYDDYPYENRFERYIHKLYDDAKIQPQNTIPSINYVHKYVEDVLKQMPIITAEELSAMWNN